MNPYVIDWNYSLLNNIGVWRILGAILVLIVGIIVSKAIGGAMHRAVSKTAADEKGKQYFNNKTSLSSIAGTFVKYFLMLVTLLIVLELLQFRSILNPFVGFVNAITVYIPFVLAAVVLAAVAHLLGTIAKQAIQRLLMLESVKRAIPFLTQYRDVVGTLVYALIILLFAPSILASLHIPAISEPVGYIVRVILNFVPLVVTAGILIIIGHFIAKFVAKLVEQLAVSLNLQRWTGPQVNVPAIIGNIVYFLILFPIAVQAMSVLQIYSIQEPAQNILNLIMAWIPKIAIAVFLLYIGYLLAKIVWNLTLTLLAPIKLDEKLKEIMPNSSRTGSLTVPVDPAAPHITDPAGNDIGTLGTEYPVTRWIANIIAVLVFGFFLVEATNVLELGFISTTVAAIMAMLPRLILAAVIVLIGIWIGQLVVRKLKHDSPLRGFIQPLIIVLASVIALTEIGLASIIITTAFMFTLGALAVAFIISVGIGSIPAVKRFWDQKQNKI